MRDLDINEVARRAGVPASTLRFYEEKGLITSIGRRGLRRLFDPGVLERLALIALGRTSGFSLDEIARMFAPDGRPRIDRRMLAAKAEELDQTIRELTALRDGLRHAAGLPRAELHGMSHLPAPAAGRRVWCAGSAKEASSAVTVELGRGLINAQPQAYGCKLDEGADPFLDAATFPFLRVFRCSTSGSINSTAS